MNTRLLTSIMIIGFVGAGLASTTMAMFNDTETSADNEFVTGELDLQIDWEESYNGDHVETQNLTDNPGSIFDLEDLKPGDHGEATVSLHLDDNPGWIWMNLNQTYNGGYSCTEPEKIAEDGDCGTKGELGEELEFTIWADDGDNVRQEDEKIIFEGTYDELEEHSTSEGVLLDGNPETEETEPFPGGETGYVGIKWNLPLDTGNKVQSDSLKFDLSFYTEQRRHNDNPENPWNDEEPKDDEDQKDNQTPVDDEPKEKEYYQVDFVGGEPIEDLGESTYSDEGRMQRYMHGGPGNPVDNESEPDQVKTGTGGPDCVDSQPFEVDTEENTATLNFQVNNITPECATGTKVSLVSYAKDHPGWNPEKASEQELFDHETERFDPGMHSMTIDIPDVNDEDEDSSNETEYSATQDGETTEITPIEGDEPVEELYDFRLPDSYDNEPTRNATNGASFGSGPHYGSAGTEDLQQADTSLMFLYDGPEGLSLVVVHEGVGSEDGGSATFEISNLNEEGQWVVKDDLYLNADGSKASSNYDIWNVESSPQVIDWTWGGGGSDGGALRPLGEEFEFTIDPIFNENAELYNEYYTGEVDEWQILSGERENPERTTLNMTEEVTVQAQ